MMKARRASKSLLRALNSQRFYVACRSLSTSQGLLKPSNPNRSSLLQPHQAELVDQSELEHELLDNPTELKFTDNKPKDEEMEPNTIVVEPHQAELVEQLELEHDLLKQGLTLKEYLKENERQEEHLRHHIFE